jgi:hypothetical protein
MLDYQKSLVSKIRTYWDEETTESFLIQLNFLLSKGHASKLINFIKAIGEQDANN